MEKSPIISRTRGLHLNGRTMARRSAEYIARFGAGNSAIPGGLGVQCGDLGGFGTVLYPETITGFSPEFQSPGIAQGDPFWSDGFPGLKPCPKGRPGIEISYVLARPFWGKGYATEAGRVAIIHAFEALEIPRVINLIHPNNRGSIKVTEKLGETFEREMQFNGRTILVYGRDNPMTISNPDDVPRIITKDRARGGTEQNRLGRRAGIFGEREAAERSFDTDIDRQL